MSMDTLGGLPTFNPLAVKSEPTQQRLSDINTKAIILNYPSADWNKSRKGILAPVLDRKDLGDYNMTSRYNFDKRRSVDAGATASGEWSRPITALTPFGIIYPDGTIGPANPENPTFDQEEYSEEIRNQESLSRSLDMAQLQTQNSQPLGNRLPHKFADWVLEIANQLNQAPTHVVATRMQSLHLPRIDISFKHQIEVVKTLYTQGKLSRDVFDGLKHLILTDDTHEVVGFHAANTSKIQLSPKTVRRKGALWPDDGGNIWREASTADHKPYAEYRCESAQEEYTTTIKSFNTTVSGHDSQALRDVRPAGQTSPGGHAGGEAFGNVTESVQNIEEALTRRTTSPITSVYMPRRMSEVTICHYDTFHGQEKNYQIALLDASRPDRLVVSPKVPKTLGVDAVLYDSSRYVEASKIPTKTEVGERIMEPFVKSNWMTVTTQRSKMRKDEVPAMYTRTPGRNIH